MTTETQKAAVWGFWKQPHLRRARPPNDVASPGAVTLLVTNQGETPLEAATQTNLDPRGAGRKGFLTGENVVPKLGSDLEGIRGIWGERYQETHWDGLTQDIQHLTAI